MNNKNDPSIRIVLNDPEAEAKICSLSVDYFWDLIEMIREDELNSVPYELHFKSDDSDLAVNYVVDPNSECVFVSISGEGKELAAENIMEKVGHWTAEEMFDSWDHADNDTKKILSILRIGVGAPQEYEVQFATKFAEGIASGDRAVREATLSAIGYRDWPEFDPVLQEVADTDEDARCRQRASIMLEIRGRERGGLPG